MRYRLPTLAAPLVLRFVAAVLVCGARDAGRAQTFISNLLLRSPWLSSSHLDDVRIVMRMRPASGACHVRIIRSTLFRADVAIGAAILASVTTRSCSLAPTRCWSLCGAFRRLVRHSWPPDGLARSPAAPQITRVPAIVCGSDRAVTSPAGC